MISQLYASEAARSWCTGCRSSNLGASRAVDRDIVRAHSRVVYMTSTHSHMVQVRATAQDCSQLRRVMQNCLLGLCGGVMGFWFTREMSMYAAAH